jgi:hypothetical protein
MYFVHSLKLSFQFAVYLISLFDGTSKVITILAAFAMVMAVFPLGHIFAPILAPKKYAAGPDPLFLLLYLCLW